MIHKSSCDPERPSGWLILIRAHDHVCRQRGTDLRDKMRAQQILIELSLKVARHEAEQTWSAGRATTHPE